LLLINIVVSLARSVSDGTIIRENHPSVVLAFENAAPYITALISQYRPISDLFISNYIFSPLFPLTLFIFLMQQLVTV